MHDSAVYRNLRGRIPAARTRQPNIRILTDKHHVWSCDSSERWRASHSAHHGRWLRSSAACPPPWCVRTERPRWEHCRHPATKPRIKYKATGWNEKRQHLLGNIRSPYHHVIPSEASPGMRISHHTKGHYLCLRFCGGTKFKEELHNVAVSLLGGKKQSRRPCLDRIKEKD